MNRGNSGWSKWRTRYRLLKDRDEGGLHGGSIVRAQKSDAFFGDLG